MNQFNIGVGLSSYWVTTQVGDIDGDGKIDLLFVSGESGNGSSVLLGNGDGTTFASPLPYDFGPGTYMLQGHTLADFNGDGLADLASADRFAGVVVHMNAGGWSWPGLRITDATMAEGNASTTAMTFTVTLTHAAAGPVTAQYATANGTAVAGSDYQATSGTLTFAPGEMQKTITVPVIGDRIVEETETFLVNLSNAVNAAIADGQSVATILDDEPRISISDVSKSEGRKQKTTLFTFTVTLSVAYDQPVTMSYRTSDGTAKTSDADYVATTGTLTFALGETTKTVTVVVKGDSRREADETFYLDLFGNGGNSLFTNTRGIGTILNDD